MRKDFLSFILAVILLSLIVNFADTNSSDFKKLENLVINYYKADPQAVISINFEKILNVIDLLPNNNFKNKLNKKFKDLSKRKINYRKLNKILAFLYDQGKGLVFLKTDFKFLKEAVKMNYEKIVSQDINRIVYSVNNKEMEALKVFENWAVFIPKNDEGNFLDALKNSIFKKTQGRRYDIDMNAIVNVAADPKKFIGKLKLPPFVLMMVANYVSRVDFVNVLFDITLTSNLVFQVEIYSKDKDLKKLLYQLIERVKLSLSSNKDYYFLAKDIYYNVDDKKFFFRFLLSYSNWLKLHKLVKEGKLNLKKLFAR